MKEKSNILEEKKYQKRELIKLLIVVILFLAEIVFLLNECYRGFGGLWTDFMINKLTSDNVITYLKFVVYESLILSGYYLVSNVLAYILFLIKKKKLLLIFTVLELIIATIYLFSGYFLSLTDFILKILPIVSFMFSLLLLLILNNKKINNR